MSSPRKAIVRVTSECMTRLEAALMSRYPDAEWATFFTLGWRMAGETLVITIVSPVLPEAGDMDESVGHVRIFEPYSLRAVLATEHSKFGLGVIHSHPENCPPAPSSVDDDMDEYYRKYFGEFLGERPYASLIVSRSSKGTRSLSGRVWLGRHSFVVDRACIAGEEVQAEAYRSPRRPPPPSLRARTARAASLYGDEALGRLWRATVAVVGVGGTGSAAAHVLARAGVGRLVLIDGDHLDATNIERVHGSYASHAKERPKKVEIVRALCMMANPDMEVVAIDGNCLQSVAKDWLVQADLVLGCTDTTHSRVGLSELAYRYLVPVIDVGVQLDGHGGRVECEVAQFVNYMPGGPCAFCCDLVNSWALTVELMTEEEREERRRQADAAIAHGARPDGYWRELPQLLTVGDFTTVAGALGANYAKGLLTGRFKMPAPFFQIDALAPDFGFVGLKVDPKPSCACVEMVGHADQGAHRQVISAPSHWPPACVLAR